MVANPAAVNVSDTSEGKKLSEQGTPVRPARHSLGPEFGQKIFPDSGSPISFSKPNAEALYSIRLAGYGPQLDQRYQQDHAQPRSPDRIYGDYWDVSLTVFSLSAFEAQLLIQMTSNGDTPRATPQQGNDAYILTRRVLEAAAVTHTDEDNVMEDDQSIQRVDLKA